MVIESGRVVDYGDPYTLIKQQGPLCSLIMHLGKKNAEEITRLAKESELRRRASRKSQVNFLETIFMWVFRQLLHSQHNKQVRAVTQLSPRIYHYTNEEIVIMNSQVFSLKLDNTMLNKSSCYE